MSEAFSPMLMKPDTFSCPSLQKIDDYYGRIIELGKELGIPVNEPFIKVFHINKHGYREKVIDQHSQSIVRNLWIRNVYVNSVYDSIGAFGPGVLRYKDINAALKNGDLFKDDTEVYWTGVANLSTYGVVIGRGSDPESPESYVLTTQITQGTGADQMVHSAGVLTEGWNAGGPYYWASRARVFDNQSPDSITVTESGIYARTSSPYIMVIRDLDAWGAGQAVAVAESIEVTYELRVNFP
jgi:hypothetical protein